MRPAQIDARDVVEEIQQRRHAPPDDVYFASLRYRRETDFDAPMDIAKGDEMGEQPPEQCPRCGATMELALDLMIALKNSLHGTNENSYVQHCKPCNRQQPTRNEAMERENTRAVGMGVVS